MSKLDYVELPDGVPASRPAFPFVRAFTGVVGAALTWAGLAATHSRFYPTQKTSSQHLPAPVPTGGVDKVCVRAVPLGGLQLLPPSMKHPCLFSYGVRDGTKSFQSLAEGASVRPGWVYGVRLQHGDVWVEVTGTPGDVVQGRLLCWPPHDFETKLRHADQLRGFDPKSPEKNGVRRLVAAVVLSDGSAEEAYFHYHLPYGPHKPFVRNQTRSVPLKPLKVTYTGDLPIHPRREEIIEAILKHQVVVIAGETGSGKTTQIPKFLLDAGFGSLGLIGCTQPRRVAALSVAERIAEELGVTYGVEVGTKIRFTDNTRVETRVKVMTDGILLNEIQDDPFLTAYEAIIIDEAHERSLNIDFILGCLRQLQLSAKRPEFKIIITSATIDTESFSRAFGGAPIIEVSGRMFPVDVRYRPVEELLQEKGDLTYIDAAASLVNDIVTEDRNGDVLVFLPGERDIQELRRKLAEIRLPRAIDVLPLFGRLDTSNQQKIFHPQGKQRVILSTNIAETSLTVPGIRYVVDTGLARLSRYSAHSRTQRLPIERISQSSANQRKGRCGRVSNGVCYRLYSEEDFMQRPNFTSPEIHRSNLASVILRMLAFNLGDIRTFPFIDPPPDNAIKGGYRLLEELDAVSIDSSWENHDSYRLTKLGRRLAQLPVDPIVSRMVLQGREEKALEDVLVIAAGLSIQDPRDRPAEAVKEADEMQKRFVHPESDFLTLLNIWNAYHDEMERLSQGQLRKFCSTHFLSYQRMREWRDIHDQLERILQDLKLFPKRGTSQLKEEASEAAVVNRSTPLDSKSDPRYAAIHRSILTGLFSNVAEREENYEYKGTGGRKAMLFPGSGLFDNAAARKQRKAVMVKNPKQPPPKISAPKWIVCAEWMETSRLYARTAAKIEVKWIEELGGNLIKLKHSDPFWSMKSVAVFCEQRKLLFGLEIANGVVPFSRINPDEATNIFVREALIKEKLTDKNSFLLHNAEVRKSAESELARFRLASGSEKNFNVEDRLFTFYRQRLQAVGSQSDLRNFAKLEHGGKYDFLKANFEDLVFDQDTDKTLGGFPRSIKVGKVDMPLRYKYDPGDEAHGVSLGVTISQLSSITQGILDTAVPGFNDAKVDKLLRGLPKSTRVALQPIKERAADLAKKLDPGVPLSKQLGVLLKKMYGVNTLERNFVEIDIPQHLKTHIQIENAQGEPLLRRHDLSSLRKALEASSRTLAGKNLLDPLPAWSLATKPYEREKLTDWNFGDLPERIDFNSKDGTPLSAFPALVLKGEQQVDLRLIPDPFMAQESTRLAWPVLGELLMGRDLTILKRELNDLKKFSSLLMPLGSFEEIKTKAWEHLRRHLFHCDAMLPLKEANFKASLKRAETERRGIVSKLGSRLKEVMEARQQLLAFDMLPAMEKKCPGIRTELNMLAPPDLLVKYEFEELPDLARFLRAMKIRIVRAKENFQRDIEKSNRVKPFEDVLADLEDIAKVPTQKREVKRYRMLLEEFKISVYAQEVGTKQKVSERRLDELADEVEINLKA